MWSEDTFTVVRPPTISSEPYVIKKFGTEDKIFKVQIMS